MKILFKKKVNPEGTKLHGMYLVFTSLILGIGVCDSLRGVPNKILKFAAYQTTSEKHFAFNVSILWIRLGIATGETRLIIERIT